MAKAKKAKAKPKKKPDTRTRDMVKLGRAQAHGKKPPSPSPKQRALDPLEKCAKDLAAAGYCAAFFVSDHKPRNLCTLTRGHDGAHHNTSTDVRETHHSGAPPSAAEFTNGLGERLVVVKDHGYVNFGVPDRLPDGEAVFVTWPGTADGTNRRRGILAGYTRDGRPMVNLARVNSRGEYTGELAAGKGRTFERHEVFSVATECNSQLGAWEAIRDGESAEAYDARMARGPTDAESTSADALAGLPWATPIDGSVPACVDEDGKTARDIVELAIEREPRVRQPPGPWKGEPNDPPVSKRREKAAAGFLPHARCGRLPEVLSIKDPKMVQAYCPECNTPPHTRDTRELVMAAWNTMNAPMRSENVPVDLPPDNLPRPVIAVDDDGLDTRLVPVSSQSEDARLLSDMAKPVDVVNDPVIVKERYDGAIKAIDKAIDRVREKDAARTVAKAAVTAQASVGCPKCGSAMLTTRSGAQRVCARCDYHDKVGDVKLGGAGGTFPITPVTDTKSGHDGPGPQIGEDFLPPLEDELPPDEGKMPWE